MLPKFRFLLLGLLLTVLLAGCGRGVQSDLKITNTHFGAEGGGKNRFLGTVENTGNNTYSSVFIVVYIYENDDYAGKIQTSANLFAGSKLGPGQKTSFDKDFDDGGFKPNRYELVRLYGVQ